MERSMSSSSQTLRDLLIRNLDEVVKQHRVREPHYDSERARLAEGTAAKKLGAAVDILAPGKRVCPYHLHHAQEEMFVVLEGSGTLRVGRTIGMSTMGATTLHVATGSVADRQSGVTEQSSASLSGSARPALKSTAFCSAASDPGCAAGSST
jgi:uncharacterized cupin superfamily protein